MKIKTWQYVVIGLLVTLAVGILALDRWVTPYDLAKERAAARAAGLPLTPAEFVRPVPPPGQDAAPDWLALSKTLRKHPLTSDQIDRYRRSSSLPRPEAAPAIRRFLAGNGDVVGRIHQIALKRSAAFPHTWSADELFPHLAYMRTGAKIIRWESWLMAHDGRYEDAVRNQALGFHIADQAATEPLLIGMLVSAAVDAITLRGLEDILRMAGPDPAVCAAVQRAIAQNPPARDFPYYLRGETVFSLSIIRQIKSISDVQALSGSGGFSAPPSKNANPLVRHYIGEPYEAVYLHWMTRAYQAAQQPASVHDAATDSVLRDLQTQAKRSHTPALLLAAATFPAFAKADTPNARAVAARNVLTTAAGVMAYKARTGAWPARLDQVMPRVPDDPFRGRALGYRREGNGFVVYSVGESGTFEARPSQSEDGQAFFRYPEPGGATGGAAKP